MKKFLIVCSALIMMLSLAACGGDEGKTPDVNNGAVSGDVNEENGNNSAVNTGKITVEKVRNAPETSADNFTTSLVDGGLSLEDYTGDSEIVVIPDEIDGMPVVAIDNSCFSSNEIIKGIKISDNIENIYDGTFANCINLEIFISGKEMKTMGEYTFYDCASLGFVELNDGLISLGLSCFYGTDSLEEIYMPASITDLAIGQFLSSEADVTIICEAGSAAESYAKENEIKYEIK